LNSPEKYCLICNTKNEMEATVCINCGASLDENRYTTTSNIEIKINYSEKPKELHIDDAIVPRDGIAIYFAETTKPFIVRTDREFVIGRRATLAASEDLLDLSDFDGFKMGLSRRHAMIRRSASGYEIIDLSSTNGTWLNDAKLEPYTPYPLPSGSRLLLSRIRLFVFYQSMTESKKSAS